MKTTARTVTITTYASTLHPEVTTESAALAPIIEWADAHPVVWTIVRGSKSKPYGKHASTYIGWAQGGDTPAAVLERVRAFSEELERDGFFGWRACFTLDHYGDKGFKGGLLQQHDGSYDRFSAYVDYTPDTLDSVIDRFLDWCNAGSHRYETAAVKLDGKVVREVAEGQDRKHYSDTQDRKSYRTRGT